jgi:hypothetical protein
MDTEFSLPMALSLSETGVTALDISTTCFSGMLAIGFTGGILLSASPWRRPLSFSTKLLPRPKKSTATGSLAMAIYEPT